jgi:GxxExxY protein
MGLRFEREKEQIIFYEGYAVGTRRVDFLVDQKILVELRSVIELDNAHLNQAINYVETFDLEVGLLINFGSKSLQFKRVFKRGKRIDPV